MNRPREPFRVGTLVAEPGTRSSGYCSVEIDEEVLEIPIVIVHGEKPGPILAVTAGVHGGEYVSMVAVREFVFDLDPTAIQGTVVASLQSSPLAFLKRTAFVNPMDGENLNRAFPGDPNGGPTRRLAYWLWSNIISRGNYYIDCHSGDIPEALDNYACISNVGAPEVNDASLQLASQFDVPRVVLVDTAGTSTTEASRAGIPSVLIEVGGEGKWSRSEVAVQREGLDRIVKASGLLDGDSEARTPLPQFKSQGVMCESSGLWFGHLPPGASIEAGALLGVVRDPFGSVLQEARSPVPGVVIYELSSLAVNSGDLIASIATPMNEAAQL